MTDKHWLYQPEPGARWLSRGELALRIAGVIVWIFSVIVIIGATQAARAATSADVEREISGAFERSEVSTSERWALAAMIVADVAGNESTVSAIGRGCRESNPLYGSSPGRAQLYAVDAVVWAGYLWAANRPGWRVQWFGYVRAAISVGKAVSNWRTEC